MSLKEILSQYGRVDAVYVDGKVQGVINGYSLEIEEVKYGYTVYLFLNDGIRKSFSDLESLSSFLYSLKS